MRHATAIAFAAGIAATLAAGTLLGLAPKSDDKHEPKHTDATAQPADAPDPDAMMEMFRRAATPGPQHAHFKKYVGDWAVTTTFQMPGDPQAMESTGSMHGTLILGGRFVQVDFHLDDMMGQPFDGVGITGYDNTKGQYQGIWMDVASTHITMTTGTMSGGSLTMQGTSSTPMGENGMKITTTWQGDDQFTDTFYDQMPDGSWVQTGTITYTRR